LKLEVLNLSLNELTVADYLNKIKNREISVEQVVKNIFKQIDRIDKTIKAYLYLNKEEALLEAKKIDRKIKNNDILPLAGLPVAINDNICTRGIETTAASNMLKGFIPPYDATVIKRIRDAGGIIIGKTNLDEFTIGASGENSAFQVTLNPWDRTRVPGGASGGSAAAVAADEALIALGTDTGGSVRLPASFCGVPAIKPTYGRISRYGVIAPASSLEQIGIIGKEIKDLAILLNIISGYDELDSTSSHITTPDFLLSCREGIDDLKIGIPKEFFGPELDREVKERVVDSLNKISRLGGKIEETSLPHIEYALPAYSIITMAEASSNLARFDGIRYGLRIEDRGDLEEMYLKTRGSGFGAEVIRRILLGTYTLSSSHYQDYFLKAQKIRSLIKEDFDTVFQKYDLLIGPTSPVSPFKIGEKKDEPLAQILAEIYTSPVNLAGLPAISINCGFTEKERLPVGLQIIGPPFQEQKILRVAYNLEQKLKEINSVKPDLSF
jgi:aspartyl-tRNA(Asn)/glutamyl-tRNA(Gln) amidotransferase subunit A